LTVDAEQKVQKARALLEDIVDKNKGTHFAMDTKTLHRKQEIEQYVSE
jgi:hypothetical protein